MKFTDGWKVFAGLCIGLLGACLPEGDAGECSEAEPCAGRGKVCNLLTNVCEVADVNNEATAEGDAPADFSNVPLPFFRGKVCVATDVKPGETVPVKISPCVHTCVTPGSFAFKKQYTCSGSSCSSLTLLYYPSASGAGCPADVFGKFDRSQCAYTEGQVYNVSAGPYTVTSGPVNGIATVELPFLANDDIAELLPLEEMTDQRVAKTWELANKYPLDEQRVFQISMNAGNPSAPADCSDESKCTCREIGF